MENIEKQLAARLFRATCPTSELLGEYHLKMLPDQQATAVKQHLNDCPHCRVELAQLGSYLADLAPDVQQSLNERVKIWIARLIPPGTTGSGELRPALALRGGDTGPLMYEAGAAQLSLEVQDDPEKAGAKTILGLLIGVEPAEAAAHLWQGVQKAAQVPIDEIGNFVFTGLAPGKYELIVSGLDFEIHVQEVAF